MRCFPSSARFALQITQVNRSTTSLAHGMAARFYRTKIERGPWHVLHASSPSQGPFSFTLSVRLGGLRRISAKLPEFSCVNYFFGFLRQRPGGAIKFVSVGVKSPQSCLFDRGGFHEKALSSNGRGVGSSEHRWLRAIHGQG